MQKIRKIAVILLILAILLPIFSLEVNATKVIEKNGVIITKISNPNKGEREVDGLIAGGDRENSYTWRLAERGDYIYIATTRNIASALVNMYADAFAEAGLSKDMLWSIVDVITNGNIPRNDENNGANIISYNRKTGEFKVIYTAEKYTYFRMAVTFGDNVYFGSYSANPSVEQYILKLDKSGNFTKVFRTKGSVSLRGNCIYDDHLFFAGADEREVISDGDGNPTKIAVIKKSNENDTVWDRVADYKDFGEYAYDEIMSSWAGAPIWELSTYKGYIYATLPSTAGFIMFKGHPATSGEKANEYGWHWEEVVGLNNGKNEPGLSTKKGGEPGTMHSLIGSTYVFNDELYVYNFDHAFGGEASAFAGIIQQAAGKDTKASEYLRYMYDSLHNPQSMWKLNDKTGKFEECKGFTKLVEGTTNEYVWRAGEYDGQMYISTMDASIFYNYLTRLTNGSFNTMTDEEIEEQIGYINKLIELITDKYNLDEKIDTDELEEKLEDAKEMLSEIDKLEINKENVGKFLDEFADVLKNIEKTAKDLKNKVDEEGAEKVVQDFVEEYNIHETADEYITEENINAIMELLLNEEQEEEVIKQIKSYLNIDEEVEITREELVQFITIFLKANIDTVLEKAVETVSDSYDKIDWEGLKMYNYISDMVKKDKWGFDLIRTKDGVNFELITDDGFGDKYNYGAPSFLATEEGLYIGTCNPFYGAQLYLLTTKNEKENETKDDNYKIIEGENQTHNPEEDDKLAFTCNIDYELFEKSGIVYVDGKEVDKKYYSFQKEEATDENTKIIFTDEFIKSLSEGEHSFKVALSNGTQGEASTNFTINSKTNQENSTNPKTGDNIEIWFCLMIISTFMTFALGRTIKQQKRKISRKH